MTGVALRRASEGDIETIVAFRVRLQREARGEETNADVQDRWRVFFSAGIGEGSVIVYIAEDAGHPIAVALGYLRPYLPRSGSAGDCEARVHNVFVDEQHRRRGVARAVVVALIAELRTHRPIRIVLSPTDQARPLYASLGFLPSTEMVLKL